jgi:hypothetical protein
MAIQKLLLGFTRYGNDALDNKAREIVQGMTGNPHFPTPVPALADVQTALTIYQDALSQASKGGTEKTAIKNQRRRELETLLKRLGSYVEDTAQGNDVMLISSGFDLAKLREPVGILQKPAKVKVISGPVPGSVKILAESVAGAESYLFEYTLVPPTEATVWNKEVSTSRTFTITNLLRGKEYIFRVAGVGAHPMRVYSDTVSMYVQ